MPIPWLENCNFIFPDAETAMTDPDGLLAASQILSPELILEAYKHGIFPWYSDDQPVLWWSPNPRCVFTPGSFHVSRSFKRTLNKKPYTIKTNTAFREVMLACAEPRKDNCEDNVGTWISQEIIENYSLLHEMGYAHSIECWHQEKLIGGMYGLMIDNIFFGESMFSKMKDASKVAMHYVCTEIKPILLDAQVKSDHLMRMGAQTISRLEFISILNEHIKN